jgi:hypothetical protein
VHYYTYYVNIRQGNTLPPYYQVAATRWIPTGAATDMLTISATTDTPIIQSTNALKFSVFKWLFSQ